MAYLINGQPVNIRTEYFRADGVRYENLLNPAIRAKLGVVETNDPDPFEPNEPLYDQRFYLGVNNPKRLDDIQVTPEGGGNTYTQTGLKTQWIAQVKDTAGKVLAQSDWVVIRKIERNVDIPTKIASLRSAIISECNRLETEITACKTVEELIAVVTTQKWPLER
jgi:hypothetical protein